MKCIIVHKTERTRKTYLQKAEHIKETEQVTYTTDINKALIFATKPAANQMMREFVILQKFAEVQKYEER